MVYPQIFCKPFSKTRLSLFSFLFLSVSSLTQPIVDALSPLHPVPPTIGSSMGFFRAIHLHQRREMRGHVKREAVGWWVVLLWVFWCIGLPIDVVADCGGSRLFMACGFLNTSDMGFCCGGLLQFVGFCCCNLWVFQHW
jgi:hypothetical protein